jgi:MFS family permease
VVDTGAPRPLPVSADEGVHDRAGREPWHPSHVAALAAVSMAGLFVSLTLSVLIPVLPKISRDLHSSTSSAEWLLTSTLLVAAVAVPVLGRLGDLYGKRLMLLFSTGFLTVGSLIAALSTSLAPMVIGRALTGLSMAAIPLGISLLTLLLPAKRADTGVALISAMLGIGSALGLPLAGLVSEHADYHILFWICAAGGVVSLVTTWRFLDEPPERTPGRFDVPGALLLTVLLIALLLPLSNASAWGWASGRVLGLLSLAAALIVVFVLVELRLGSPLVDIVANKNPGLLLTNLASMCVGFALFASFIGTASYVQAPPSTGYGFGSSVLVSCLCLLPSGLAMLALSPMSALLSRRFGPRVTLALGAGIVAAGFLVRIVLTAHFWQIMVGTTVAGAGTGVAYAAMPALIARAAPHSELAAANGLNSLARSVGSSLASAVGGTVLASQVMVRGGAQWPSLGAYRLLFGLCAAAATLGAAVALRVPTAMHPTGTEIPASPSTDGGPRQGRWPSPGPPI